MNKTIQIGISDFKELIEENNYFVDKSLLIKDVQDFFAANKIAKCKWPERIEIVKSLPRTASGKVRKFLLRDDIKAKLNSLSS